MKLEQIKRAISAGLTVHWMTGLYSVHIHDNGDLYAMTNSGNICWLSGTDTDRNSSFLQGFTEDMFFMPTVEYGSNKWEQHVAVLSGFTLENTGGGVMCFCFYDDTNNSRTLTFGWGNGPLGFSAMRDNDETVFYGESVLQPKPTPKDEADYMQRVLEFFPTFIQ